ncbi:MAG: hypothetical protein AVDCRST_MAG16-1015 [uncultured Frankineae bacterium]|uniref:Uncharacterized protein n=1 Tax=uncultured Frankineae bacterium TaxID=437475 RepID=A0A6J4L8F2_9ACTN|nr:MAG: hypothetical protein AVDCRST_MAG16-1015 [uncultured Frankineae bacterium]
MLWITRVRTLAPADLQHQCNFKCRRPAADRQRRSVHGQR